MLIEESEVLIDDVQPIVKDEIDPEMDHVIKEDLFCSTIMENCENLFLDTEDLIELT